MDITSVTGWRASIATFTPVPLRWMIGTLDEQKQFAERFSFPGIYAWVWRQPHNIVYVGRTTKHVSVRMREHLLGFLSPAYVLVEEGVSGADRWGYNLKDENSLSVLRNESAFLDLMRKKHRYLQEVSVVAAFVESNAQKKLEDELIDQLKPVHNATRGAKRFQDEAHASLINGLDSAA